jgi:hypothetical protein
MAHHMARMLGSEFVADGLRCLWLCCFFRLSAVLAAVFSFLCLQTRFMVLNEDGLA